MLKIIGGSSRGILLAAPKGRHTRPTLGRVRESIFNVLANVGIIDTKIIDLFAGTGAMGLEALSRGASSSVFIDQATRRILLENIRRTHNEGRCSVIGSDIYAGLGRLAGQKFDYVFLDPPYHSSHIQKVLEVLAAESLLAENAVVIAEHGEDETVKDWNNSAFQLWKLSRFGETAVSYLKYIKT